MTVRALPDGTAGYETERREQAEFDAEWNRFWRYFWEGMSHGADYGWGVATAIQRRLAERAVETLLTSRPHVLGAVLNRVDIVRNKYYYSRYYGYKYKNYYVKSTAA